MTNHRKRLWEVDVLVVGGGIAGSLAALGFVRDGLTTALLDFRTASLPGDEYEHRVSSINLHSEAYLTKLGVWDHIQKGRMGRFDKIQVWDAHQSDTLEFDAADCGLKHLGHILENNLVAGATHRALLSEPDFLALPPGKITNITPNPAYLEITSDDDSRIRCQLLVAADGANSTVRKLCGISRSLFDYRQQAIVARVFPHHYHGQIARQKFMSSGPLAFLPLADESCSVVWSLADDMAQDILAEDDTAFSERLESAFDGRLGRINHVSPRVAFPLKRSHAARYIAERTALVGDACHTVHPLAGLGANQGIADVATLCGAINRARKSGQSYWSPRVLERYQRQRRSLNAATLVTMDLFHLGFANQIPVLSSLRGKMLSLVNKSTHAKGFFVQHATGLSV